MIKFKRLWFAIALPSLVFSVFVSAQSERDGGFPAQVIFTEQGDHRNMMEQLGIRALRPGADPKNRSIFDEADANRYPLPQLLIMKNGTRVRNAMMEVSTVNTKQDDDAAVRPVPRTDRNSMLAHEQLLEKAKKGRIDVYFLGDSITRRWGTSDKQYRAFLDNWRKNFFGWNAANFGWGGDTAQNILWRLQNGELDHVNPKVIVLMAGTNNVGNTPPSGTDDPRVAQVTLGIRAILEVCRSRAPEATIVLMGITPRNDNIAVMPIIDRINQNIARFADGKKIRYLNINDKLADKDGRLFEGMATDDLHLDVKSYQVWADALKPILKQLLGPPSKEDHAPPPSGDPSAQP
ncbi:MAG TPA: GDSL-type esterase/lipase family protein [Pyrinomonadaceae bacterium]|nr:GDSL-type esterase/lipase family protein [Pyrinomonadaceae bacterium]